MIDVTNKKCCEKGCTKQPTYNLPGETKGIYCFKHKKDNMIDVKHPHCKEEGCTTRPCYNLSTEKKAIYCKKHKKDGMINITDKNANMKVVHYFHTIIYLQKLEEFYV